MMAQSGASPGESVPDFRLILQCMENMRQNVGEKLLVSTLAKQAGMSRSTFLRRFSAVGRCTPLEYLSQARIEKRKSFC